MANVRHPDCIIRDLAREAKSRSRYLNWLQAEIKGSGVFCSPMPMTCMPLSRKRATRRVKSESELTMANPSTFPEYRMSIASMIIAESVAFLPAV